MAYWRKLFLILLLALSLPVQSFAAVSMKCDSSHSDENVTSAAHAVEETPHAHHVHGDWMADVDHADHHRDGIHHVHQCSACASCCVGAALPVSSTVAAAIAAIRFAPPSQLSVAAVQFLTDGIERPPRLTLV
ncbi:hypothetical protein [Paraburkholderia strydomiana]|uniref:Cobalt transporter n=1 Tax=Paraburkholderia strydomiana TaxID=1245417 RepID=A0ABW9BWT9_9BURK